MELSGILTVQTVCVVSYESNFPRQKKSYFTENGAVWRRKGRELKKRFKT